MWPFARGHSVRYHFVQARFSAPKIPGEDCCVETAVMSGDLMQFIACKPTRDSTARRSMETLADHECSPVTVRAGPPT